MIDDVTLENYQLYNAVFTFNLVSNYNNQICMETLKKHYLYPQTCCEVFYDGVIFFAQTVPRFNKISY